MSPASLFFIASSIAVIASLLVIISKHAVHALLYMVVSLLALSVCFYLLGAPFAAALQIIVYAGAIMVLFVFALMLFNIDKDDIERESSWLSWRTWIGPSILAMCLLAEFTYLLEFSQFKAVLEVRHVGAAEVGTALFGPYLLAVEIASFLLLAGLVGGYHLARHLPKKDVAL